MTTATTPVREGVEVSAIVKQLSAGRELTALRTVLDCSFTATALREGSHAEPGTDPAWLAFLCPAHSDDLPGRPGTATQTADGLSLPCGTVMDLRPAEQLLQSHADLWLTPLTGVDPQTLNGVWSNVLDQSYQALRAREERSAAGEDEALQNIVTMISMARRNAVEGDLCQAATVLGYCETLAQCRELHSYRPAARAAGGPLHTAAPCSKQMFVSCTMLLVGPRALSQTPAALRLAGHGLGFVEASVHRRSKHVMSCSRSGAPEYEEIQAQGCAAVPHGLAVLLGDDQSGLAEGLGLHGSGRWADSEFTGEVGGGVLPDEHTLGLSPGGADKSGERVVGC